MPFKSRRKASRRYRPRKNKRASKAAVRPPRTVISKGLTPLGDRFITSLKYAEDIQIAAAQGGTSTYQFRLNSLYDPNLSGTGHQPYGFDQISALYSRYRVFKVKYRLIFSASALNFIRAAVLCQNDVSSIAGLPFDALQERPRASVKYLNAEGPTNFVGMVHLPQLCGASRTEYMGDDRYQANTGANPLEAMNLNFGIENNASGGTVTIRVTVLMEFYAEFFDPVTLTQS